MNTTVKPVSDKVVTNITWRLIPLLLICYIFAHLDRVNIGFAKDSMSIDLGLTHTMYGTGAGLFFIAYMLFGVPSNMMLEKFGPRRWIAIIMVVWGLLSTATMFITNHIEFYILRFLLGVAEAGFFPGILIYINRWFPTRKRGKITAMFTLAVPLASVIGAPISGWIIDFFHGSSGMHGWQWMFLLEGLPVVLLGIVILFYLPDHYSKVTWLTDKEKEQLHHEHMSEESFKTNLPLLAFLKDAKLWLLFGIYFAVMLGINANNFWMPNLIKSSGIETDTTVGLLTSFCWGLSCIFMILTGMSADRHNERRWHLIIPLLMAAVGFIGTGMFTHSTILVVTFLSISIMGAATALPMFWQIPPMFLSSKDAIAGIALVSSLGNLAGFLAPYLIGWVKDMTGGSPSIGLYILALLIAGGAALVLLITPPIKQPLQQLNPQAA